MDTYMKIETKKNIFSFRLTTATIPLFFGIRKRWSKGARVVSVHFLLFNIVFTKKSKHKKISEGVREVQDNNKLKKKTIS